ncbi:MAG: hypothetical protein IRZ31_19370 [Thermogemmatispora sp.]|uniref:hypothetical protein n=1 Tax=Thermogemmatispora sp. TaxID=1968838 RepID=UPI002608AD44|nr:hypothetical protein [Thermogemmatispora sp.]MBX5459060.1 hypothetical protein [Thermogemmatispora sp.]
MWSIDPDDGRLPDLHAGSNGHARGQMAYGGPEPPWSVTAGKSSWSPPAPPASGGRRRASRRLLLFALAAILLLALIVGAAFYYGSVLRSTPEKSLAAFCTALSQGDPGSAYHYLDSALQRQASFQVFAGVLGKTERCSYEALHVQGTTATAVLRFTGAGQLQTQQVGLNEEGGTWLISEDEALTALPRSLSALCSGLETGKAEAAYARLTPLFQHHVSLGIFRLLVDGITSCSSQIEAVVPTQAKALVVVRYRTEVQPEQGTALLVPAADDWLIDALSSLSTPERSLLSFCKALQQGTYDIAYELLSLDFQAHFGGLRQFINVVNPVIKSNGGIKSCSVGAAQKKADRFIVKGVITYANGKTETDEDELVLEADIWRLNALS